MAQAWRIVRSKYIDSAFNGEGAAEYGGRWNSRGTFLVYTSSTMSLAALEILVHYVSIPGIQFSVFKIEFDDNLVETIPTNNLPSDWKSEPPTYSTKKLGDDWVKKAKTPVLAVPSALIPSEVNYLINPIHPEFKRLKLGSVAPFAFDPRLLK